MDLEKSLVARVIDHKEMQIAVDQGASEALFFSREGKQVWEWLLLFYKSYGESPTRQALGTKFPHYELDVGSDDALLYILSELRKRRAHNVLHKGMQEVVSALKKKDPYEAVSHWRQTMLTVDDDVRPSRDVSWPRDAAARWEDYRSLRDRRGIQGLDTPWPTLNQLTMGIGEEEFWMIVARAGIGKTWCEVVMAHHAWLQGTVPLLITKEMSVKQILRRLDAAHFQLPYQHLRSGMLDDTTEDEWREGMERMQEMHDFWVSGDDEEGGVSGVAAKIDMYRPTGGVFIDGGYLLADERRGESQWQRIQNISRDLKRLARRTKVSMFCSFQLNRQASTTRGEAENIALADISRDADGIIGLFQSPDDRERQELSMRLLKQREGAQGEWLCRWDFEAMQFFEIGQGGEDEAAEQAREDKEEQENEVMF